MNPGIDPELLTPHNPRATAAAGLMIRTLTTLGFHGHHQGNLQRPADPDRPWSWRNPVSFMGALNITVSGYAAGQDGAPFRGLGVQARTDVINLLKHHLVSNLGYPLLTESFESAVTGGWTVDDPTLAAWNDKTTDRDITVTVNNLASDIIGRAVEAAEAAREARQAGALP
jgi:hypothetical protein